MPTSRVNPARAMSAIRRGGHVVVLAISSLVAFACGSDTTPFQPATGNSADGLYWNLTFSEHAITLSTVAPYDTMTLAATPRDGHGHPLTGLGVVTFTSSDPQRLQISADGVLHAIQSGTAISVTAELTVNSVSHTARAVVNVTSDSAPVPLASIDIAPLPPDSARWAALGDPASLFIDGSGNVSSSAFRILFARAIDTTGAFRSDVAIDYASSDTSVANVLGFGGPVFVLSGKKPGHVSIIASATVYGVSVADTVPFTITMPFYAVVKIQKRSLTIGGTPVPTFLSSDITISPGGSVLWVNLTGAPVDVTFDDPAQIQSHGIASCAAAGAIDDGNAGNIAPFGDVQDPQAPLSAENCRSRGFVTPGTYTYRTQTGAQGKIVVNDGVPAT